MNATGATMTNGKDEKCIYACRKAKKRHGVWSCPMFKRCEIVYTANERGVECRYFERRFYDDAT